jgi:hypothetical protein
MNAELSQKAGQLIQMFYDMGVTFEERERFVQAVAAAPDEDSLPAFAKDLMRRAAEERTRLYG